MRPPPHKITSQLSHISRLLHVFIPPDHVPPVSACLQPISAILLPMTSLVSMRTWQPQSQEAVWWCFSRGAAVKPVALFSCKGPMERKLAEFRARKAQIHPQPGESDDKEGEIETRRNSFIQMAKEKMHSVYSKWRTLEMAETPASDARIEFLQAMPVTSEEAAHSDVEPNSSSNWKTVLLLKFLLWLVFLGLFVELEFGLAYFLISMFYWMYEGTRRSGLKKKGEKSAYSVFNPGCEAIEGSLTAEQFEKELKYGALAGI